MKGPLQVTSISIIIVHRVQCIQYKTRHKASISMYSLTFCVRFLLPECHQWKSAVQTAAVMLRTPPLAVGRRPRPLPVCCARFWRRPRPAGRSHYIIISRMDASL